MHEINFFIIETNERIIGTHDQSLKKIFQGRGITQILFDLNRSGP